MKVAGEMLSQIWNEFHPQIFFQFIMGYKLVCFLMLVGYLFHFTPRRMVAFCQGLVTRAPFIIQLLILVLAIFIVVQLKSAGVQPFIYFQF